MQDMVLDPCSLGTVVVNSGVIAVAAIRDDCIAFANPAFLTLFHASGDLRDVPLRDIVFDCGHGRLTDALAAAAQGPTHYFGLGRRGDNSAFDLELSLECSGSAGTDIMVVFARDVSEQQRSKEQLTFLAYQDVLTGLPNRALFADRLHQAVLSARRRRGVFAVLVLDLDGFKAINDTNGHEIGDVTLRLVGQRFQRCVRDGDTIARIGGDEFAVLLPDIADRQAAAQVAQRLITALEEPIDLQDHLLLVGVSIGIAAWPEHAGSGDALVAAADTAMYCAKRLGRNCFRWATLAEGAHPVSLTPLAWQAAHTVGVQELDDQHIHLAALIDQLSAALKDGAAQDVLLAALTRVIEYTAFHFGSEEQLMHAYALQDTASHRDEHRRLLRDIHALRLEDEIGSISLILQYLQEWLLRHVDGPDKALGAALVAKGCR